MKKYLVSSNKVLIFALEFNHKCECKCKQKLETDQTKKLETMKTRKQNINVSRERAIEIAMNHNCVSREIAEQYTDCELKEVLKAASGRTYKLTANF